MSKLLVEEPSRGMKGCFFAFLSLVSPDPVPNYYFICSRARGVIKR